MAQADFNVVDVAEKDDAAAAELDQVFAGEPAAAEIVAADDWVGAVRNVGASDDEIGRAHV